MPELEDGTVDLIITSPPYKDEDGFNYNILRNIFHECKRVLTDGGLLFVNFGHLAGHKHRPFRTAELVEFVGFNWIDTIVWLKHQDGRGHFTPIQGSKRLNNLWEPIFLFAKDPNYSLDRLAIGVPFTDKSNIDRFGGNVAGDLRCPGNVWFIPYDTITDSDQKTHKDRFPLDLPKRCIMLAGIPKGSLILDPFCGSGTTLRAGIELGMQGVGYEINPECVDPVLKFRSDPTDAMPWF